MISKKARTKGKVKHIKIEPLVVHEDGSVTQDFTEDERRFFEGWQPITSPVRVDKEESERVGRRVLALPKQCWFNARKVVQKLVEYAEASYVEGIAVAYVGHLIEHGWVCRPDGTVIDPTLPRNCIIYFPGLEFVGRAGIKAFLATPEGRQCRRSPFLYAFGWGGQHSPSFSGVWNRAMEFRHKFQRFTGEGTWRWCWEWGSDEGPITNPREPQA